MNCFYLLQTESEVCKIPIELNIFWPGLAHESFISSIIVRCIICHNENIAHDSLKINSLYPCICTRLIIEIFYLFLHVSFFCSDGLILPEALVGGIVGGILFLLVAVLLAVVAIFHSRRKSRQAKDKKYSKFL